MHGLRQSRRFHLHVGQFSDHPHDVQYRLGRTLWIPGEQTKSAELGSGWLLVPAATGGSTLDVAEAMITAALEHLRQYPDQFRRRDY